MASMKSALFTTAALAALALASAGCRQRDIRVAVIRVPTVVNPACEERVLEALKPIKGIQLDTIAYTNGVFYVHYDSMQLGLKNIEHAIKDAGFDANEFEGDPAARAKLPKECLE